MAIDLTDFQNRLLSRFSHLIEVEGIEKDHLYQVAFPYLLSDPRITFMKRVLELMLSTKGARKSSPCSFRLKNLKDWILPMNTYTLLSQMSWNCGSDCIFCFQKGCPKNIRFKKRASEEEILTRLKYFEPQKMLGLVGDDVWEGDEILNNPHIIDVLKELRRKGEKGLLKLVTNGTSLTEERIRELARLKPLMLVVSLNSADPALRRRMTRDPRPETAINSLSLLMKHEIPYIVSVVPWPGLPFPDILKTIKYADDNGACFTRLLLTGYSKYFPLVKKFNARKYWVDTISYFGRAVKGVPPPVFLPSASAQEMLYGDAYRPFVMGTFKNSPANMARMRRGDLLLEVEGQTIDDIEDATQKLYAKRGSDRVSLRIRRNGRTSRLELKSERAYPFSLKGLQDSYPFGIVLAKMPIKNDEALDIHRYITAYGPRRVLVLVSRRAKSVLQHLLKKHDIPKYSDVKVFVRVPTSRYFGGSVDSGDLMVVEDYIDVIERCRRLKPDMVLIPASPFSNWGRDLIGRSNLDIERVTGIRTEFIYNTPDYIRL